MQALASLRPYWSVGDPAAGRQSTRSAELANADFRCWSRRTPGRQEQRSPGPRSGMGVGGLGLGGTPARHRYHTGTTSVLLSYSACAALQLHRYCIGTALELHAFCVGVVLVERVLYRYSGCTCTLPETSHLPPVTCRTHGPRRLVQGLCKRRSIGLHLRRGSDPDEQTTLILVLGLWR